MPSEAAVARGKPSSTLGRDRLPVLVGLVLVLWASGFGAQTAGAAPTSSRLAQVDTVPGAIWDVAPDRILFLGSDGLKIKDRVSLQVTAVPSGAKTPEYGFLAPMGAIFVAQSGDSVTSRVYDWRGETLVDLGLPNSPGSLRVHGRYALWNANVDPCCGQTDLTLRDLVTGTNVVVSHVAGNTDNDVADNGDVVYWSYPGYAIHRWRNGTDEQLTHDDPTVLWNTYPVTDGINVVYRKHDPCCFDQRYSIVDFVGAGEDVLTPPDPYGAQDLWAYQAFGGWVGFTQPDGAAQRQVWLRDPAGVKAQISSTSGEQVPTARIVALNPSGQALFGNSTSLFLGGVGTAPDTLATIPAGFGPYRGRGTDGGWGLWQGDEWLVVVANTLYHVVPGPPALTSVVVTPADPTVSMGGVQQFNATATFVDASTADVTRSATWTSSDTRVATVSFTGSATGVGPGTATVRATTGSLVGSATLTVRSPVPTTVVVPPVTPSEPTAPPDGTEQSTAADTDTAAATGVGAPGARGDQPLARTGLSVDGWACWGLGLVLAGLFLVRLAPRLRVGQGPPAR